ncbi:TetR/AcrR family transcriptional regulator [Amycolatopsis nigrescens]|uniref:TetR/AcrR family transcriptional regulator n=1 Tax=Amycolatopsis nigrescens TaxID=381445 RepID=UPI000367E1B6|nr:TetR/AcrR family transcriptional regulator [Amycolatopsis nigrescens]
MGNRDDLLAGAKRCLYEKGYARTTARDISAAAGTSLASIGYHFGSMEKLLNTALIEASREWGEGLSEALSTAADRDAAPLARFETAWTRIIELFATHRPLWVATFEAIAQLDHAEEVRRYFSDGMQEARLGLAALIQDIEETDEAATGIGTLYQALLTGVMAQWLIDPDRAPSGRELTAGLKAIIERAQ